MFIRLPTISASSGACPGFGTPSRNAAFCRRSSSTVFAMIVLCGHHRYGESHCEGRPLSRLTFKIDGTVMQLHDAERHGEPDSRSTLFGREVQIVDLFLHVGRNS